MQLKNKNNFGFSLVQVMIVAGLMGGLSLIMMKTMDNLNTGTKELNSFEDELSFRRTVNVLMSDPDICRVSLAGSGSPGKPDEPITFFKKDVDRINATNGLDVEIYLANQDKTKRSTLKFSASDQDKNKFGSIIIDSMKLFLLEDPLVEYEPSELHKDMATLVVKYRKKTGHNKYREKSFKTNVLLKLKTDENRVTTLLSCGVAYDFQPLAKFIKSDEFKSEESGFFGKEAFCKEDYVATGACTSTEISNCSAGATKLYCHKALGRLKRDNTSTFIIHGSYGKMLECPPLHSIVAACSGIPSSKCITRNGLYQSSFYIKCAPLKVPQDSRASFETYEEIYQKSKFGSLICPDKSYLVGMCSSGGRAPTCQNNFKAIKCARIIN